MYLINIRNFFYRGLLFVFLEEKVIFFPPPTILLGAKILVLFVLVRVFYVFAFIVLCAYIINIGGFRAFLPFRSVVVIVAVAFFLFACFSVFQSFY